MYISYVPSCVHLSLNENQLFAAIKADILCVDLKPVWNLVNLDKSLDKIHWSGRLLIAPYLLSQKCRYHHNWFGIRYKNLPFYCNLLLYFLIWFRNDQKLAVKKNFF
ncbi:Uncharacterized protein TCM_005185, partial [Theobroma cacao]